MIYYTIKLNIKQAKAKFIVFSGIIRLLLASSPSTIFFAIIPINVNSIDTRIFKTKFFDMFKIRPVHIIPKFFKRSPKALYTSSSVYRIVMTFRIIATSLNSHKSIIKTTIAQTMRKINEFNSMHTTQASTRFSFTGNETAASDNLLIPTTTFTKKKAITPSILSFFFDSFQITKFLTY